MHVVLVVGTWLDCLVAVVRVIAAEVHLCWDAHSRPAPVLGCAQQVQVRLRLFERA